MNRSILTLALSLVLTVLLSSCVPDNELTFGMITDVHADMLPDNGERMGKFIDEAQIKNADFIIQLGDFCRPRESEKQVRNAWEEFEGEKYHVLGNHDMDLNSKDEIIKAWGMPSNYYSFDKNGYHFIVLDANYLYKDGEYIDYNRANYYVSMDYRAFISPEQIDWLKEDLDKTAYPTLIFSHQSLINVLWGVKNRIEVHEILEDANKKAGFKKVIACFNGHDHIDFHREINGIHYFEINSLGYQWINDTYNDTACYDSAALKQFVHLNKVAVYNDPLYAFVTIKGNKLILKGVQGTWFCSSPEEKGLPEMIYGCEYSPSISDYEFELK